MSPTIHRKNKYFHSTLQTAEDRRRKFHFCRLPFDVTSCLISLLTGEFIYCSRYGNFKYYLFVTIFANCTTSCLQNQTLLQISGIFPREAVTVKVKDYTFIYRLQFSFHDCQVMPFSQVNFTIFISTFRQILNVLTCSQ